MAKTEGRRQQSAAPRRVLVVLGTRPEAIKLAPVVMALKQKPARFRVRVLATAQHREMLDQVLDVFGIRPDYDLNVMQPDQLLPELTSRLVQGIERVIERVQPGVVVVQGDTTTAFAAALAAYYRRTQVAHVEAGLRTDDKFAPFPEEMNRRLVTVLSDVHFAPTRAAKERLLAEGVPGQRVHVTGNTVIDALQWMVRSGRISLPPALANLGVAERLVLATAHRRESFGPGLSRICRALLRLVARFPDVRVLYPVHPNPSVAGPVKRLLSGQSRITLTAPLGYPQFVAAMNRCHLILTDSGGIQEEAPALGKPVLVMRETTERPEAVAAGTARLVGTNTARIVAEAGRLLGSRRRYEKMARAANPFGDGHAAARICRVLGR